MDIFAPPVGAVCNRTGLECLINSKIYYNQRTTNMGGFMVQYRKHTLPIAILGAAIIIGLLLMPLGEKTALSQRDGRNSLMLQKALIEVIRKADVHYYEHVDQQEMFEGAIKGALAALDDPYSFYLPPVDQKREEENLYHAKFGGLGIRIMRIKVL